ncbi:helix-turn-helix domain-containing protein [Butyrivibrio proteoclasticus]|uniref:helix-turn-helix domain-containing protein n=1 Tax=Butyrivibrio proteoclasticus TaxID=43305 RepID=UPI0006848461|nr:helix-turn-helix domain-containing protein [Butyrivibrio proteoclasticus]
MNDLDNTNILGRYLQLLRKDKGVKQHEVARAIGIQRATYSHYENGRIIPPTSVLASLSSYYDIKLDKLVDMALSEKRDDDVSLQGFGVNDMDIEEIIYYYQKLSEADRQLIKIIIKDFYREKVKK